MAVPPTATLPTSPSIGSDAGASELAAAVQWLVDRAAIGDVVIEFARTLDAKEWDAHVALYLPDGTFSAGEHLSLRGHDELRRTSSARALGQYAGTWHLSSNHAIHIDGDRARVRSYLIGVHVISDDATDHADGGGWYDSTLVRTPDGWRFETVRITEVWRAGKTLPHMAPPD